VDHTTFNGKQAMQFSRDDVARILVTVISHVLEALNVQHTIEGIAVLPAGGSTYLVDIVLRDLSSEKDTWGVSVTIPHLEDQRDEHATLDPLLAIHPAESKKHWCFHTGILAVHKYSHLVRVVPD
jgi:hypothetical protein